MEGTKKLRVGVIGCGKIVEMVYLPALLNRTDVEIVSVLDIPSSRFQGSTGGEISRCWTTDFVEFKNSKPDYVIISSPNYTHKKYVIDLIPIVSAILCEKPFVLNSKEWRSRVG